MIELLLVAAATLGVRALLAQVERWARDAERAEYPELRVIDGGRR